MKRKVMSEKENLDRYARLKLKDLIEFGYPNLTLDEVKTQLDKVIAGEKNLDVIGLIIKQDYERANR